MVVIGGEGIGAHTVKNRRASNEGGPEKLICLLIAAKPGSLVY